MAAPDLSGNHRGADRNGVPRVCDHNERISQACRQGDRKRRTTYSRVADRRNFRTQTIPCDRYGCQTGKGHRASARESHSAQLSLCGSALAQKCRSADRKMCLAQERIYFHGRRGGSPCNHSRERASAFFFFQTWPGWTFGTYRAFDLAAEDSYLADMTPWSATFTGHLEGAEAIYNGARGNLVGIKTRLGNTPQHGVLFGMTGAGKSVIVADLLAQIGHRFGFRLIV